MKVKLLTRKGAHAPDSVVDYDPVSAHWLIEKGHAVAVKETVKNTGTEQGDTAPKPTVRRGRPRKDES